MMDRIAEFFVFGFAPLMAGMLVVPDASAWTHRKSSPPERGDAPARCGESGRDTRESGTEG